jgi:hypothetical protein
MIYDTVYQSPPIFFSLLKANCWKIYKGRVNYVDRTRVIIDLTNKL